MLGDLLSSFLKRRMGLAPSCQAIGLDQIPESLLPLLACWFFLPLTIVDVVVATVIFFVGELSLSRVLFKLGIRIAKSGERTLGCVGFGTLEGKFVCLSRGRSLGFAAAGTLAHNRNVAGAYADPHFRGIGCFMVGARGSIPHTAGCQCPPVPCVIAKDAVSLGNHVPAFHIMQVGSIGLARLDMLRLELRSQLSDLRYR